MDKTHISIRPPWKQRENMSLTETFLGLLFGHMLHGALLSLGITHTHLPPAHPLDPGGRWFSTCPTWRTAKVFQPPSCQQPTVLFKSILQLKKCQGLLRLLGLTLRCLWLTAPSPVPARASCVQQTKHSRPFIPLCFAKPRFHLLEHPSPPLLPLEILLIFQSPAPVSSMPSSSQGKLGHSPCTPSTLDSFYHRTYISHDSYCLV